MQRCPDEQPLGIFLVETHTAVRANRFNSEVLQIGTQADDMCHMDSLSVGGEEHCVVHLRVVLLAETLLLFSEDLEPSDVRRMVFVAGHTIELGDHIIVLHRVKNLGAQLDQNLLGRRLRLGHVSSRMIGNFFYP